MVAPGGLLGAVGGIVRIQTAARGWIGWLEYGEDIAGIVCI